MSAIAYTAGAPTVPGRTSRLGVEARERLGVRIVAFTALALYGVLRWAKLMATPPTGRLLALLAIVVGLGVLVPLFRHRGRAVAVILGVVAVLAAFPLSGVPLSWVVHVRIAVTADAIGQGLSALPGVLLPYSGANEWVRTVTVMGAAVLLLDAGLLLAFAPPSLGDLRRAGIALPLIALAVVPSTLLRPKAPYLHGLLLFALIAAFLWGERVRRRELAWALTMASVVAVAAVLVAPSLDQHRPWIDYQSLAGRLAPAKVETFDWSQRYGPLNWPQTGRGVLEVQAKRGDYWKAEDLATFDGRGWVAGGGAYPDVQAGVSPVLRSRWTQTIHVTLRAMTTSTVIAAGTAEAPKHISRPVGPGASPGTWVTGGQLGPGDSYLVSTYAPRPSTAQLATAGNRYPDRELAAYRAIDLPGNAALSSPFAVLFPPFHSKQRVQSGVTINGQYGAALVNASPYAAAYALAGRLAAGAATPYAFVTSVERYLAHGYTYSATPLSRSYPLESFLFQDKVGYCQQFAGAMALLLRMGGIPARVSAGFTPGTYVPSKRSWVVSDLNAHAWVEAWFPHYGWVRFDPTPSSAPARGGHAPIGATPPSGTTAKVVPPALLRRDTQVSAPSAAPARHTSGSSSALPIVGAAAGLLGALGAAAFLGARRRAPGGDALLTELERALARSGRPAPAGLTLAALEQRLRGSPEAAAYVRAIRLARFGTGNEPPTAVQRRALRAHLRDGLGFGGAVRALWALPPRWAAPRTVSRRPFGPLNF